MKEPAYKGKEPLPLSVYVSARAGDPQAVERLLRYYDNYMNCLCTRTLYDEDGYPHLCVDEQKYLFRKEMGKILEDCRLVNVLD